VGFLKLSILNKPGVDGVELLADDELSAMVGVCGSVY
jgi:hypothetical protein